MRTYRQKIYKDSLTALVVLEKKLQLTKEMKYWERQYRKKLWQLVDKAHKEGKKASWHSPDVIIDGRGLQQRHSRTQFEYCLVLYAFAVLFSSMTYGSQQDAGSQTSQTRS